MDTIIGMEGLAVLEDEEELGTDLETGGRPGTRDALHFNRGKIAVISLYGPKSDTAVILHPRGKITKQMISFMTDRPRLYTGHNVGQFDSLFMEAAGFPAIDGIMQWFDTMLGELAVSTLNRRDLRVSLQSTAKRRLGKEITKKMDHSGWMNPTLTEDQVHYCVDDIQYAPRLRTALYNKADKEQKRAIDVEQAVMPITSRMTYNGLPLDLKKLRKFLKEQDKVAAKAKDVLEKILKRPVYSSSKVMNGCPDGINLSAPKQIVDACKKVGINITSSAVETLETLAMFPGRGADFANALMGFRHANQRKNMYSDEWIEENYSDGYVHPRIWQCGTDTGRMSTSDPNGQQIPRDMRGVFGGVPGYKVVSSDYSQIEVVVAAAVSGCPGLRAVIEAGRDIHRDIGAMAFSMDYEDVTEYWKTLAKALTFTIQFVGSWQTFLEHCKKAGVKMSEQQARAIFTNYFKRFPGMANLINKAQAQGRGHGAFSLYLPTGLKRVLVGANRRPSTIVNTMVQGGAAAGLKYALLEHHARGLSKYVSFVLHDEIVALVPNKEVKDYVVEQEEAMKEGMMSIMDIPVRVKTTVGDYWSK